MNKNILFVALPTMICFSACHFGNQNTAPGSRNSADTAQVANAETSQAHEPDARCEAAVSKLRWKDVDRDEAAQACQLFHAFLLDRFREYEEVKFVTHPAAPYYFMEAFVEREVSPSHVIHVRDGVLPKNSTEAIQAFAKHIDMLNTTSDAKSLAYMLYAFHAKDTEALVTVHQDKDGGQPEMNPPEFLKNEDGGATLTYDLQNTGRSMSVRQCVITIGADDQTTQSCAEKK